MKVKQQQKTNTEAETESRGGKACHFGCFWFMWEWEPRYARLALIEGAQNITESVNEVLIRS